MSSRRFAQVDVFSSVPLGGNPVAVVLDGDGLTDAEMAAFARWTNLSETTFLQASDDSAADYRLRIFTPTPAAGSGAAASAELPFAGHPTLGSAHAWLAARGADRRGEIVQDCGAGRIRIRVDGSSQAFAAPPLQRGGPVDRQMRDAAVAALGVRPADVLDAAWVDNGPGWMALRLASAAQVLDLVPDMSAVAALDAGGVGVIGGYRDGAGPDGATFEVRAFAPGHGIDEDPVTGSLNAGLAVWLRATGDAPQTYVAAQGTALGRAGRVHITDDGTDIWVGGPAVTVIEGTVEL